MRTSELLAQLEPAEAAAQAAYEQLATLHANQPALAGLLRQLAHDEATHLELLARAAQQLRATGQDPEASIEHRLDPRALSRLVDQARAGRLTENELITGIVQAEFSEWNEVFLYVLAQFRRGRPEFQRIAAVVQQHKRRIEAYLGTPATLPQVWHERLLIVDDEEALRYLLGEFLGELGAVTVAANGAEALALTQQQFFDVIITDVDMPVMNGLDFYRAVAGHDSPDRSRFIFVTGKGLSEVTKFIATTGAPLLLKPFALAALRQTVLGVLNQSSEVRLWTRPPSPGLSP